MRIIIAGRDSNAEVYKLGEIIWTGKGFITKTEPGRTEGERKDNIDWVQQCRSELQSASYELAYRSMEQLQFRYCGALLWVRFEPDYEPAQADIA